MCLITTINPNGMKRYVLILLITGFLATSCKPAAGASRIPPGQAKKITGSKSAKTYAPGQRKKINE
jgi:hypothetical protein